MTASMVTTASADAVGAGFARDAEALHERGESAQALHVLTAGVRRFPGDVTALLVLARVCAESGRDDEARDWLAAALRLDPGCPAALAARSGSSVLRGLRRSAATPIAAPTTPRPASTPSPSPLVTDVSGEGTPPNSSAPSKMFGGTAGARSSDSAQKAGTDPFTALRPEPVIVRREPAPAVASTFVFPVREEDEEPEIDENSAPHVATVTLAEIYLQQGLKEQAAQIYRQLLERQPEDDSARRRLNEILREIEAS